MPAHEQRILRVVSALGEDKFLLDAFTGREALSRPFEFELELASDDDGVAAADVVGQPLGFALATADLGERWFHGRVQALVAGGLDGAGMRRYRARVVPWLWFLKKRAGCRIFQKKSALDIAEALFGELGFADFELAVDSPPPALEYCVQYRESDFDFLSRLFEEHGLHYFFRHSKDAHVLVVTDGASAHFDCAEGEVACESGARVVSAVTRWDHGHEFITGKWTARDFDYLKPSTLLESQSSTVTDLPDAATFEHYDYPGRFLESADGDARVRAAIESEEARYDVVRGESTCASFSPAGRFQLVEHDIPAEAGGTWLVTEVAHVAHEPSLASNAGRALYTNTFACIPAKVPFRPARTTPKPRVHGPQTAIVVGPAGEEIHTDEHGRIRVQFHWDREGQKDDASSCWVRVAQSLAGKAFGAQYLPRIGHEVVVSFLEGDPDRPLVTGAVYNAEMPPPFALPDSKTQSGYKSRSSLDGTPDDFNELRFEDKKGSELVYFHAQKDESFVVENDQSVEIGHDQSITVGNDRSEEIGNDRALSVGANKTETVGKSKSVEVTENHQESIGKAMSLSVGENRSVTVGKDLSETISGNRALTVSKDDSTTVSGNLTLDVSKDATVTVAGKKTESITKELSITAKKVQVTGQDEIALVSGSAKVVLKKNGDITIEGGKITIKGSGNVVIKGSSTAIN